MKKLSSEIMKGFGEKHQTPKKKSNDNNKKTFNEQTINIALKLHSEGNLLEAKRYYESFISQGLRDERIFSNYGILLKDLEKLQEAEFFTQKAITLNPAKFFGLENIGLIVPGFDADIVVWDNDPLELMSNVEAVLIGGEMQDLSNRQDELTDRYLKEKDKPNSYRSRE